MLAVLPGEESSGVQSLNCLAKVCRTLQLYSLGTEGR